MKRFISVFLLVLLCLGTVSCALADEDARAAMIDEIVSTAQQVFTQANGKLQRAQYSGDIYICKNFTAYLFR